MDDNITEFPRNKEQKEEKKERIYHDREQALQYLKQRKNTGARIKDSNGLTAKQEAFARHVSEGDTLSGAYRKAYDAKNMKQATIWNRAHYTYNLDHVRKRIDILLEEKRDKVIYDAVRARDFVIERLQHEALHATAPGARVRALELLGKREDVGLFTSKTETTVRKARDPEEIERELSERLRRIAGPADKSA